jgi:diphosphomevalonate decarboxylase
MTEAQFIPKSTSNLIDSGSITWQAPSNIALVKYWGKRDIQIPENASVSFTLRNCHTQTTLDFQKKDLEGIDFEVYFDGKRERGFEPKILKFFQRIEAYVPFIQNYRFIVETSNSFPHSSGIASSASGLSALALCLVDMERIMFENEMTSQFFNEKASFLARLGSGSAARSIQGPLMLWGAHTEFEGSSNLFGIRYPHAVHDVFMNYKDTILLVDKGEKQVSSTGGHNLMHDHPYAKNRFMQANANLGKLKNILETGDLTGFISLVESEALQLHAMMMTSLPYYILMKPNTLEIIRRIWEFRKDTQSKVCFTLDAGANVHVLYPESENETVLEFIKTELSVFCKNGDFIEDNVGAGAIKLGRK